MTRWLLLIFLAVSAAAQTAVGDDAPEDVEAIVPISASTSLQSNSIFKELQAVNQSPQAIETAKIRYLIQAVKKSPYTFIRNSASFNGTRAAQHLLMKYRKRSAEIESAEEFIDSVATRSAASGEPYLVRIPSGKLFALRDVLHAELDYLQNALLTESKERV